MPLEVRELVIKAQVGSKMNNDGTVTNTAPAQSQEEVIKQCVEKVLEILKEKSER